MASKLLNIPIVLITVKVMWGYSVYVLSFYVRIHSVYVSVILCEYAVCVSVILCEYTVCYMQGFSSEKTKELCTIAV